MDPRERAPRSPVSNDSLADMGDEGLRSPEELPVVARLMVEIRSDGTTTVARGAMEDALSGQKVAVHASGSTPLALALSLAKSLASGPWLARQALRALIRR
jgi:hypothetical protein